MADLRPAARGGPALQGQSSVGATKVFPDGHPAVSQAMKRADVSKYSNEFCSVRELMVHAVAAQVSDSFFHLLHYF